MALCKSCGADIIWATTLTGKRMPVDAYPSAEGNVFVTDDAGPCDPFALVISGGLNPTSREIARRYGVEFRTSHFASCPHADQHRKA